MFFNPSLTYPFDTTVSVVTFPSSNKFIAQATCFVLIARRVHYPCVLGIIANDAISTLI